MRLDVFLYEQGYVTSRTEAKNFIAGGAVTVDGKVINKPSFDVSSDGADIKVDKSSKKYASRAGFKLEAALDSFKIDVCIPFPTQVPTRRVQMGNFSLLHIDLSLFLHTIFDS